MVTNGSCNGIGCCQTSIPKGVKEINIEIQSYNNHTNVSAFNPCSYAFLADLNWFTFHGLPDLSSEFYEKNNNGIAPLVLDWAIGNQTCEEAKRVPNSDYACASQNSKCYDSTNGPGYRCNCNSGYKGNPYLHGGCVRHPFCITSQEKPGCQDKCGNISIPYPFGIGENCFREGFGIDCNSTNDGLVPFISGSNIDITNISLSTGEIIVTQYIARDCYNRTGFQVRNNQPTFKNNGVAPLVLDWAVGNQTCEEAKRAPNSDHACVSENSENSNCYDSTNGPGYRCNCNSGYKGNPYLHGGCQDIDECKNKVAFPCRGICTNTQGNYSCECPKGKHSINPILFECKSLFPVEQILKNLIGHAGIGIPLILILIGSWIYLGLQTRKFIKMKEKFFKQNGGFDLQRLLNSHPSTTFKIFSKEELERATNNFDEKNVLGRGGNGTVFKGVLADNHVLAIKKSSVNNDEVLNKQFANEIFILSQINHKNVVKLLGCCVEVEIPMLVYEFISNGTLFEFIHSRQRLCLNDCLRIATEAASALSYLHWDASPPILHGDVKSSNILLDKNLMVKVSDFGTSKLTPKGTDQFVTFIQGTRGYLDPEYLQTGQLTDKSDVYSFGVVLLELLTRKMAFFRQGIEEERNLANVFLSAMKEERLIDVLDHEMVNEGRMDLILEVCNLAKQCLNIGGEERPTMKEVAMELEGLIVFRSHPWVIDNSEDTERLIGGSSDIYINENTDCYTADKSAIMSIKAGR
ncbi:Wall-associated receptor kinase 5 [Acorus gramineus]|uniref:Wall-associated receptor kinase 5 n=1 Tax=Acorus gramineus TaxID=55184 RepID=A0AAV9ATF7_ACOGR|nr:Wall-associated receptor kinase 5 [Acorus gramineus]